MPAQLEPPRRARALLTIAAATLIAGTSSIPAAAARADGLRFEIALKPSAVSEPVSGRLYVMLGPRAGIAEPRTGPNWFNPQPFFAVDVENWAPGTTRIVDDSAIGYPGPLSELPAATYAAQAVLRLNPDTHNVGTGEGNAHGPVVVFERGEGAGKDESVVSLVIDRVVPPREFRETDRVKLLTLESERLTAFHGRPIRHRAGVLLPEGYDDDPDRSWPTLYVIPGFGGDHEMVRRMGGPRFSYVKDFVTVVLDPDCGTGHHVFADSATNGPRGAALVEEFIPHVERTFRVVARPEARLLNGHSSGGWSSLWLQVTHPDTFGGTWSTSPDSIDFRDFSAIDIHAPGANLYRAADGSRRPIARMGGRPVLWLENFVRMERVLGDGGQMGSFEAVFSPSDPANPKRPRPLWDRDTGAIDPVTAEAWNDYDIRLVVEREWPRIGPKLSGKIHVYTGEADTFYLEGAVKLAAEAWSKLPGFDGKLEVFPGKDHGNILDAALSDRISAEMRASLKKAGIAVDD